VQIARHVSHMARQFPQILPDKRMPFDTDHA
jgi:hypothetical protein